MTAVLRKIMEAEAVESASHGWSCVNCLEPASFVITPGGYRLCAEHAELSHAGHVANGLPIERREF